MLIQTITVFACLALAIWAARRAFVAGAVSGYHYAKDPGSQEAQAAAEVLGEYTSSKVK